MPVKFDPKNKDVLLSSARRRSLDAARVLSMLPLLPRHHIADIGCGPGYFTIPLGKYAFDGKVYALDVQEEMLEATREALKAIHLTNVEVLKSTERKLPLEDECLDGALLAFVLQEASYRSALLKETRRCLRKSGWAAIMEWHKKDTENGPPLDQRIDEEDMKPLVEKAGFRVARRQYLNGGQYMYVVWK